ncbi:MAG: hypothetical protein COA79_06515 [Planctomycetota bacterium]|nr:MAG: hypothetical protein COA79_06515 [Planctomycetota bacterium]
MSYFSEYIEVEKEEIADGVFIERRNFLKISALAAGSMFLSNYLPLRAEVTKNKKNKDSGQKDQDKNNEIKKLMTQMTSKAQALIKAENPDEEKYLKEFTKMVSSLKNIPHAKKTDRKIKFTSMYSQIPLKVYQIRMLPGTALRFHDHRNYNGIVNVLEGSATIRNFDFAEKIQNIQAAKQFKIIETQNVIAKQGDISNLSRYRDNIHDIRAGKNGVLFLDIFTFFNNKGVSKFLKVDKNPIKKNKKIYMANWE